VVRSGYRLKLKRRRLGLTNYYKRRKLILSGKPRLVVRKTNKHIIAQVVLAKPEGDVTVVSATSLELVKKFKWRGDPNNTPAAYLIGLIIGYKALKAGVKEAILDIGLHRPVKGARVFATLKGAVDAGLKVPHSGEILPSEDRLNGSTIATYAKYLLANDPSKYQTQFSKYLERGLKPEELPVHFSEVRKAIEDYFSRG